MPEHIRHRELKCIEAVELIETALDERELINIILPYTNLSPATLIAPFTFTGCTSIGQTPTISNLHVSVADFDDNKLNVLLDVNIPIRITLTDVTGASGTADAILHVHEDFYMNKPEESIFPFTFAATASARCSSGAFSVDGVLTISVCVVIIIKMVVNVLLDVCTEGYHRPPRIDTNLGCNRFFSRPFYPEIDNNCDEDN